MSDLTNLKKLENLIDAMVEDIMELTDEELLAEAMEDGDDVEMITTNIRKIIKHSIAKTHIKIHDFPVNSPAIRAELIKENYCPDCGGELDTGWECNSCGYDAQPEAKNLALRLGR